MDISVFAEPNAQTYINETNPKAVTHTHADTEREREKERRRQREKEKDSHSNICYGNGASEMEAECCYA